MQTQDIEKMLGLQGVSIKNITNDSTGDKNTTIVEVEAIICKQNCPCCGSGETIKNGIAGYRQITHLPIAESVFKILVPRQRLKCKACGATYAYEYDFVNGKERYTKAIKAQVYKVSVGATVRHGAETMEIPYSTSERFFKEAVLKIAPLIKESTQRQAEESDRLILGIDDFAIRKGHNYNTGLHDLRGESLLGIAKGRTLAELREYMEQNPRLAVLRPQAVVMDLAKNYHIFAATYFPSAIRIADRFHVNGYIIDALNEIRRRVSKGLKGQACLELKRNKHILNKRNDSLNKSESEKLKSLLSYSRDLKAAYELKERLIDWYDLSFNYESANNGYQRWLSIGHSYNIPEIENALKTFENWRDEIINYHKCRFTNGIVEGRNGKIKSLQRRRFFLRNRAFYEALIIIECNKELASAKFKQLLA